MKESRPTTLEAVPAPRSEESEVTKAELEQKRARVASDDNGDLPSKKSRLRDGEHQQESAAKRKRGVAPIKQEYLVQTSVFDPPDYDAAEAGHRDQNPPRRGKNKGPSQNKNREFTFSKDAKVLCASRAKVSEFAPLKCPYGNECRFEHDLRAYLSEWKNEDLKTFNGLCPVWEARGECESGWKCRFVGSHMEERLLPDGRKELTLKVIAESHPQAMEIEAGDERGTVNNVPNEAKNTLRKRQMPTPKSDSMAAWLEGIKAPPDAGSSKKRQAQPSGVMEVESGVKVEARDNAAKYMEPPFLPSEKRGIYFGADTPVLAPLTTQGNLPFRELCVGLGAELTYSEMAMSLPLVQGQKSEWALLRASATEGLSAPNVAPEHRQLSGYDHGRDLRFGAQIAGNKPHITLKTTEVLTALCPRLRVVDLNCGCPIDLVYRIGAGSALLDQPARLERMLYGMNTVSGEVPITAKIRTGTADDKPTAGRLLDRLVHSESDALGERGRSCGVAAITLHGRSRQQRYTRSADWEYIASCAALVRRHRARADALADTVREPEPRHQPPGGRVYFVGNGDCYSHEDYYGHLEHAHVDGVMVARGAIVKPWIFEEIQQRQYLDKTPTERLQIVEQYVRNGLSTWGSDEMGVALTRRFVLEYLSFAYRYVPVGLLEYLPPSLQDRPPAFKGRNEMETLLASGNYKDWIKISEMYLGPVGDGFKFDPKHKSNSYEIEAEG